MLQKLRESDFESKAQHDCNELRAEVRQDYNESHMADKAAHTHLSVDHFQSSTKHAEQDDVDEVAAADTTILQGMNSEEHAPDDEEQCTAEEEQEEHVEEQEEEAVEHEQDQEQQLELESEQELEDFS